MDNITAFPSYDSIKKHQQEVTENGFLFPLNATSIGLPDVLKARVRRLSTVDRASISALPQDMQHVIFKGIKELQRIQKQNNHEEPEDILEVLAGNEDILKTANAWCLAAFIHPRLVETPDQIDGDGVWALDGVKEEDRIALLLASLDADSPQNKKLTLFRPQWGRDAESRAIGPVAEAPQRRLETVPAGV